MNSFDSADLLDRAFALAYFINRDREAALRVVSSALAKLQVAAAAQGKRLYYRPSARGLRNKISFGEAHLFQRLVYIESEPYEVRREAGAHAAEDDLLVHFVKHLVRITARRNSFYVALGLSRLLHNYGTAETMDIYNAVIQDPERVKDDHYYRSRKRVLIRELKGRFGELLRVARGPHGEERFQPDEHPARFVELVRESLQLFTPWHTPCLVPAGVDPIADGIPRLAYRGPREEDKVEVDRLHALIHPECYARLSEGLGLDAPARRLDIPRFFLNETMKNGEGRGGVDERRRAASLTEEELTLVRGGLDEQASRRKSVASESAMRVLVDGVERATLDPHGGARVARLGLDADAELIEVRARASGREDVLLATHLLRHTEAGGARSRASIVLEGGQRLSFEVAPRAEGEGESEVAVEYRETGALASVSALLSGLVRGRGDDPAGDGRSGGGLLVPALACALLVACAALLAPYVPRRNRQATEPASSSAVIESVEQTGSTRESGGAAGDVGEVSKDDGNGAARTPEANVSEAGRASVEGNRVEEKRGAEVARNVKQRGAGSRTAEEELTRGVGNAAPAATLASVKSVYVEAGGEGPEAEALLAALRSALGAGGVLTLATSREEADALLRVSTVEGAPGQAGRVAASARLVNARGAVIWFRPPGSYTGDASDVAARIASELLGAVRRAGGSR